MEGGEEEVNWNFSILSISDQTPPPLSQCELKWGDLACEMGQPSPPCEMAEPGEKINQIEISFLWRRPLELLL